MVEVWDGLAKTVLDLEEKCCKGGGWGREIRICFLKGVIRQMELKFGKMGEIVRNS